jgi:nicotinamide-nucleotide amidase
VVVKRQESTMTDHSASISRSVAALATLLLERHAMLATAESCTGGLIAGACTDLAGSSAWFERGFVTYSNAAKHELLGVPLALIASHGAVSEPVARAMAEGALRHAPVQASVAVTGVAGPTGGSAATPVGTVWFGWCAGGGTHTACRHFAGDRIAVRQQTVAFALSELDRLLRQVRAE